MMDVIKQVGAFAGLASFVGLAVLALLYFAQARDVRRLRENASFLIDGPAGDATAPVAHPEGEGAPVGAGSPAPGSDAEAFRRAELARQAEERRRRFEQRRTGRAGLQDRLAELPGGTIVAVLGAIVLIGGVVFGATQLLGGDEADSGGKAPARASQNETEVAVFNSTAEVGLAAEFANTIDRQGFKLAAVTNTEFPSETSSVMYAAGSEQAANEIGKLLNIADVQVMTPEIRSASKGASVAVVLGEDKASGI